MKPILLIEPERALAMLLRQELQRHGYVSITAETGTQGLALKTASPPSLIILDLAIDDRDGIDYCRSLRSQCAAPLIVLSPTSAEDVMLRSFAAGCDEYIVKPFRLVEVVARIGANLRREERTTRQQPETVRHFGPLMLDLGGRLVSVGGQAVGLTKREYDIVELLALHPEQVFARDHLYDTISQYEGTGTSAVIVEHVKQIRRKLKEADPDHTYIQTVWGIGYKWHILPKEE